MREVEGQDGGFVMGARKYPPLKERLMSRVVVQENGCWHYTGHIDASGYGRITDQGESRAIHTVSYEVHIGQIPEGKQLDHTCHNPVECQLGVNCPHRRCVNPNHLEPVTAAENSRRGGAGLFHRRKTHCPAGHSFTPENIFRRPQRPEHRECRECRRKRTRDWREEQKKNVTK